MLAWHVSVAVLANWLRAWPESKWPTPCISTYCRCSPKSPRKPESSILVGLISDTHGLVRPEALAALKGSELIIHAGDIGSPEVLDELRIIAPTYAVRGNNDTEAWAAGVPEKQIVAAGERQVWVLHQLGQLYREPVAHGCAAVVFGHTHEPWVKNRNGVLYINPGSVGPRRFKLPVTVDRLWVARDGSVRDPRVARLMCGDSNCGGQRKTQSRSYLAAMRSTNAAAAYSAWRSRVAPTTQFWLNDVVSHRDGRLRS